MIRANALGSRTVLAPRLVAWNQRYHCGARAVDPAGATHPAPAATTAWRYGRPALASRPPTFRPCWPPNCAPATEKFATPRPSSISIASSTSMAPLPVRGVSGDRKRVRPKPRKGGAIVQSRLVQGRDNCIPGGGFIGPAVKEHNHRSTPRSVVPVGDFEQAGSDRCHRRHPFAYLPPMTSRNVPVTKEASALASHKIARATSSGWPPRPMGIESLTRSTRAGSPPLACISV